MYIITLGSLVLGVMGVKGSPAGYPWAMRCLTRCLRCDPGPMARQCIRSERGRMDCSCWGAALPGGVT